MIDGISVNKSCSELLDGQCGLGGVGGGGIATKRKLGFYSTTGFGEYPVFFPHLF